jgi:putative hydrolase of the HAD superfamily
VYQQINCSVIFFDLGGVLIELTGVPRMLEWIGWEQSTHTEEDLWNRWLESPAVRTFETGKSTPGEFAQSMIAEFGLPVEPSQFLEEFASWPRGWYPGATDLLRRLRENYTVASLSNANGLHWVRVLDEFELEKHIPYNFPSHVTGFLKPDRQAFANVISELGKPAEQFIFLDDNTANVEAARAVGMNSFKVHGLESVKLKLTELKIII